MSAGLEHCLQAFRSSTLSGKQCCSPTASPIGCPASSATPDFVRASPDLLDYDPQISRFISEDPIGFAAGDVNLYRYCGNSPTNFTDPRGIKRDRSNY